MDSIGFPIGSAVNSPCTGCLAVEPTLFSHTSLFTRQVPAYNASLINCTGPGLMVSTTIWLSAQKLNQRFGVYGHFYELGIGGQRIPCRSVLELIEHDESSLDLGHMAESVPDLITVMMNPGRSRPLDPKYDPVKINCVQDVALKREWVPAHPDTTQYQIMRILAANGLHHSRILNISDIRAPKSGVFIKTIGTLQGVQGGSLHSIFCPERATELAALVGDLNIPVLAGWGRDNGLRPLAEQALKSLSGRNLLGIPIDDGVLFSHPSPMLQRMKDSWLNEVNQQFAALDNAW